MLDDHERRIRYFAQTGGFRLTPRQRRRIKHKDGHQSLRARMARDAKTKTKLAAREARLSDSVNAATK